MIDESSFLVGFALGAFAAAVLCLGLIFWAEKLGAGDEAEIWNMVPPKKPDLTYVSTSLDGVSWTDPKPLKE